MRWKYPYLKYTFDSASSCFLSSNISDTNSEVNVNFKHIKIPMLHHEENIGQIPICNVITICKFQYAIL